MEYYGVINSGPGWPDIVKCQSQDPRSLLPGIYPKDLYVRMVKEIGTSGVMAVGIKHVIPQRGDNTTLGEESCCQAWERSWPSPIVTWAEEAHKINLISSALSASL